MQTTCDVKGQSDHEAGDFLALGVLGDFVGNFLGLAEKVFLLRLVEQFERQRGGFDVEDECGHARTLTAKTPRTPRQKWKG